MSTETVLTLSGMSIEPYSARGLTQTLEPIEESKHFERAIDGTLLDLSYTPMRKYKSTITGSDQAAPAVSDKWPGQIVTVGCIVSIEGSRPTLTMMITGFSISIDEWGAQVSWQLDLEQV